MYKPPRVQFCCSIKVEYLQLHEKAIKSPLPVLTTCKYEAKFSSYISIKQL